MKPVTTNLAVWLGLTLVVALIGSAASWRSSSIKRHSASTQGSIVMLRPQEHQSFVYSYTIANTVYSGTATAGDTNRSFASLKVGDTVPVFYDTKNPSDSTMGPPDMPAINAIGNTIAASAVLPLLIMLFLHHSEMLPAWSFFQSVRPSHGKGQQGTE